jgi:hypothetical protein
MSDVFVSFPFEKRFDIVFETVRRAATQRKLVAIRIDQSSAISQPISESIHRRIRESRLFIADITGNNPNVLNEVGLAQAHGKPLVLITQDDPETAPFNIRNLQLQRYDPNNLRALNEIISKALVEATSPSELIRSMLVPSTLGRPSRESWFVIAASPLSYRRARGRIGGYKKLRRTSSDYVGIRGIMQSFGLLFGFDALPDTLDPEDCDDCVLREPMNLYCIASPKANRWTSMVLGEYSNHLVPRLEFRADPGSRDLRNVRLSIFCDEDLVRPAGWHINEEGDRYARDFGLIVRGPNPFSEDHMTAVIAGRSSLGTEAACIAFTDPAAVSTIRQRLAGLNIDLENHKQPFWVITSLQRKIGDMKEEAIRESLRIERVEAFVRK